MKYVILTSLALMFLSGCASTPPRGYEVPPLLRETFRGGQLKGLEQATPQDVGVNFYDAVSHTCTSTPIWHLDGTLAYTDVRCW